MESTQLETTKKVHTTTVKVSALWHFVAWYLEMINFTGAIYDDEFSSIYKQLLKCVYDKIKIPEAKDVLSEYVAYEIEMRYIANNG